jgi:hypothetical protein
MFHLSYNDILVWTPWLMHRFVCIWQYILQNYNYKLHFQNLFIYDISHVSIETLAVENLDVCITCDPWNNNIQLTMGIDQRRQIYPNVVECLTLTLVPKVNGRIKTEHQCTFRKYANLKYGYKPNYVAVQRQGRPTPTTLLPTG